jgi:hypothetical protein
MSKLTHLFYWLIILCLGGLFWLSQSDKPTHVDVCWETGAAQTTSAVTPQAEIDTVMPLQKR